MWIQMNLGKELSDQVEIYMFMWDVCTCVNDFGKGCRLYLNNLYFIRYF